MHQITVYPRVRNNITIHIRKTKKRRLQIVAIFFFVGIIFLPFSLVCEL